MSSRKENICYLEISSILAAESPLYANNLYLQILNVVNGLAKQLWEDVLSWNICYNVVTDHRFVFHHMHGNKYYGVLIKCAGVMGMENTDCNS